MLDINLGNKTLIVGVLIALILSYGMVNFDTGSRDSQVMPALKAAIQSADPAEAESVVAEDEATASGAVAAPVDGGRMTVEQMLDAREKRHS
ncbi:MAG: hypothetical protein JNK74_23670 [Candidatus Hydrogenedentes bacterium]|nr:hypothetical protein [Candidatus Hydrogenedentota bacterium]